MKIAIYIPTASIVVGGGEVVPLMQAKYLQKLGHEITVILLRTKDITDYANGFISENAELNYLYLDYPSKLGRYQNPNLSHALFHELYLALGRELASVCLNNNFDRIITHYGPAAVTVPSSVKQLLILHGVPSETEAINKIACATADQIVAVSNSTAKGWEQMFRLNKIKVVHNGIDEKYYHPARGSSDEDIDVFYVGRLIEVKGVQHLIESIKLLKEKGNYRQLKVIIGGSGPYKEELEKLVKKLSLSSNVKFTGYIPENELRTYYLRSKVCVFPSFCKEGVLTTMLEAASSAKPILTANCCGMTDFINHGNNGLLFEPKNSKDLCLQLDKLLKNRTLRAQLGGKARKDIESGWTWDQSTKKLEQILIKI